MISVPAVTCLQLSYGRPNLSVEAVESFLKQTYINKHLIIINTHHSPVYFKEKYDNITVYNVAQFPYLSDVYRYGLSLIKTPYFCIWDDDDIFLPWHIEDRVKTRLIHSDVNAVTHEVAFFSQLNKIINIGGNMFVSQYLYDSKYNYMPAPNIAVWDADWSMKPWKRYHMTKKESIPSYIYRWGTSEAHMSGLGAEKMHEMYLSVIEEKKKIDYPDPWIPMWKRDYVSDALNFLEKNENS